MIWRLCCVRGLETHQMHRQRAGLQWAHAELGGHNTYGFLGCLQSAAAPKPKALSRVMGRWASSARGAHAQRRAAAGACATARWTGRTRCARVS